MRIAFDLDGTLITEHFQAEKRIFLRWLLCREKLRLGTTLLFQTLRDGGHEIWIYTTSCRSKFYIRRLFLSYGLRLDGVVNQDVHNRLVKVSSSKYPPAFGIDLLVDDSNGTGVEGRQHGFRTIIVSPDDPEWAAAVLTGVREAARKLSEMRLDVAGNVNENSPIGRILQCLKRKHVVLIGGELEIREALLTEIKVRLQATHPVYELPAEMKTSDDYIDAIRKIFPIKSPMGTPTSQMNFDQINDMHLDWAYNDVLNVLIIWHHFESWKGEDKEWLYEFLSDYVYWKCYTEDHAWGCSTRLIASGEIDPEDFYRNAKAHINIGNREPSEVAREHLEFIQVPELGG